MTSVANGTSTRTNPDFRKIELQSHADLQHLITSARRAAQQKIELAFPHSANGSGDELRERVEQLVDEYVRNVFKGVKANTSVNGIDLDPEKDDATAIEEEYEALDAKLALKVRQLEAQKEALTEKVADQRRTTPQRAAEDYQKAFLAESEALDAQYTQEEEMVDQTTVADLNLGDFRRWDEVQATWAKGAAGLIDLKGSLTETVAKLERAKNVTELMENKR